MKTFRQLLGEASESALLSQLKQLSNLINKGVPPEGWKYASMYDFVLKEGQKFEHMPVPKGIKMGKEKECFKNAYAHMGDYIYCEGYGMVDGLPMIFDHAWLCDKDGRAFDVTWKKGVEYYGIPFKQEFVMRTALRRGKYGIIDNMEEKFPMLKGIPRSEWYQKVG